MNDSKISVRYAKALFSLAVEKNLLDKIKDDILFIKLTWEQVKELRRFLESPIVWVATESIKSLSWVISMTSPSKFLRNV